MKNVNYYLPLRIPLVHGDRLKGPGPGLNGVRYGFEYQRTDNAVPPKREDVVIEERGVLTDSDFLAELRARLVF